MRGVVAVVVAGSLGRGEPWPLSDIDIVPIYEDGEETNSSRELSVRAEALGSAWEAEGIRTDVDVGNIWFTDREAREAVALSPARTVPRLADFRWYHGIDKPYGGRAAWDPTGVAQDFLRWVNRIRFSPEIVSAILAQAGRELSESIDEAARNLGRGSDDEAGIALHRAGYLMIVSLMASEGMRCSSFGRLGSAFERAMAKCGRGDTAREVMDVMLLGPADVEGRFADAPTHVERRHRLSLAARQVTGEDVTAQEDRRDVLLAFTTFAFRRRDTPLGRWTGLGREHEKMVARLDDARRLATASLAVRIPNPDTQEALRQAATGDDLVEHDGVDDLKAKLD